jgi:superfamily II DNA helicase RecQ
MTNYDDVEFLDVNVSENKETYINFQINKLNEMINLIENVIDCRHSQLSSYFGEKIEDKINWCNGACDNCLRTNSNFEEKNMNESITRILEILKTETETETETESIITKNKLRDLYQTDKEAPLLSNLTVNRLLTKMIHMDILKTSIVKSPTGVLFEHLENGIGIDNNNNNNNIIPNINLFVDNPKYSLADFIVSESDTQKKETEPKKIVKKIRETDYDIGKKSFTEELMNDTLQEKYNLTHLPLYNALIHYRNDEAKRIRCAPYRIFNNISLEEIVKKNPKTEAELKNIGGIGEAKIKDFGRDIIRLVNLHQ